MTGLPLPTPSALADQLRAAGVQPPAELEALADQYEALFALDRTTSTNRAFGGAAGAIRSDFVEKLPGLSPQETVAAAREAAHEAAVQGELAVVLKEAGPKLLKAGTAAVRGAADDLIEQARPRFDAAAKALAKVVAKLGVDPKVAQFDTEKDQDKAALYFGPRTEAMREMRESTAVRTVLASVSYGERQAGPLWYLDPKPGYDLGELGRARKAWADSQRIDPFGGLLAAGFSLRLNTWAESEAIQDAAKTRGEGEVAGRRRDPHDQADQEAFVKKLVKQAAGK